LSSAIAEVATNINILSFQDSRFTVIDSVWECEILEGIKFHANGSKANDSTTGTRRIWFEKRNPRDRSIRQTEGSAEDLRCLAFSIPSLLPDPVFRLFNISEWLYRWKVIEFSV
jgi:hypothetical protein